MRLAEIKTDRSPEGVISARAQRGLDETDNMPGPLRQCVHEYGYAVVHAFRLAGVKEPAAIHEIVRQVWDGARTPTQRTKSRGAIGKLDVILIQAGCPISGATLVRFLWSNGLLIVPLEPTHAMVEASVDAVAHMGLVSKTEKHRGRLRFALRAAAKTLWPHLVLGA